jgi:GNAT superfamily N-acetyltransferase
MPPTIREASPADIGALMEVRLAVRENVLADPSKVTPEIVEDYLLRRGRGWVAEEDGRALGFAIADATTSSIWALFLRPEAEGRGIAKALLATAVDWLFAGGSEQVKLTTGPGTRADRFYAAQGWTRGELDAGGEVAFTLARPPDR